MEHDNAAYSAGAPAVIVSELLASDARVLLVGEMGSGKSSLARALAAGLAEDGRACWCVGADPGSPEFGPPGALCLARWQDGGWQVTDLEALCTLDAGRFRLPLVQSLARLAHRLPAGTVLIDAPGVVRGVAGAELLTGLAEASGAGAILVLVREGKHVPLESELHALGRPVHLVGAHPAARRPAKRQRAKRRTRLWDAHLGDAPERHIALDGVRLIGTPPPLDAPLAWRGRQCALVDAGRTLAFGEVLALDGASLRARMPPARASGCTLVVRDARRGSNGRLETAESFAAGDVHYAPPADVAPCAAAIGARGPHPVARSGPVTAILVNGVFGDPMLHLRLRHERRSLLFDLGEPGRLRARIAHQVSDIFVSHAHMDHIAGFFWLLRSRIGPLPECRLYGPPGLAENVGGMIRGVLWDRIGDRGPRFVVAELDGDRLARFRIQAGRGACERLDEAHAPEGVVLDEPGFRVRAATLDHGTPVLAFAFEPAMQIHIRKERLLARGLPSGAWLGRLKRCVATGARDTPITLPDGSTSTSGPLADDLVLVAPPEKLVYATDLADTPDNRARLTALARDAHVFFCEAAFSESDAPQARRTGHLTARASGEIASAAGVQRFIPFHFSRRYERTPEIIYAESRAACSRTVVPSAGALKENR